VHVLPVAPAGVNPVPNAKTPDNAHANAATNAVGDFMVPPTRNNADRCLPHGDRIRTRAAERENARAIRGYESATKADLNLWMADGGPMLRHGLQELHGARLLVLARQTHDRPDPSRLEERYEQFRAAG
jgi:hypothetical protein